MSNDFIKVLEMFEKIIYDNDGEFLQEFGSDNAWMITGVYFGSEVIDFRYIEYEGQHLSDSIKWAEFFEWWEAINDAE